MKQFTSPVVSSLRSAFAVVLPCEFGYFFLQTQVVKKEVPVPVSAYRYLKSWFKSKPTLQAQM
jgi:hypothetical protein